VGGTIRRNEELRTDRFTAAERRAVTWYPFELADDASAREIAAAAWDAVYHLAAVSTVAQAEEHPGATWNENAGGTARLAHALAEARAREAMNPVLLVVSSIEVYGPPLSPQEPERLRRESDPPAPLSAYAASKVGAEVAALQEWRRGGLRVVVARPTAHTGPGENERKFIPKYARRVHIARRRQAPAIATGMLDGVRDFLHVDDVVDAYVRLVASGVPGEIYNVAAGEGVSLDAIVRRLAELAGWPLVQEVTAGEVRRDVVSHLVADPAKLRQATGWKPCHTLDQTLQAVLDAQTD
jgi:GDP-4-dehydro-6-deoxy-D-mannose reductase